MWYLCRMLSTLLRPLLALLALSLTPLSAQRPLFVVEQPDGERLEVTVRSLGAEGWVLDGTRGVLTRDPGELRLLTRAEPREQRPAVRDLLLLVGQDGAPGARLWGELVGGDESGLRLALGSGPTLEIPFDVVDRLLPRVSRPQDRLLALEGAGFDDRVWRLAGDGRLDALSGVVARADEAALSIESALGVLELPYDELLAVVLAATSAPDPTPLQAAPLRARLRLADGSLFEVGLLDADRASLRVVTAFAGELRLAWHDVEELILHDPALPDALLGASAPVEVEQSSPAAPGEPVLFPWQRDLSVGGVPLGLGGVLRASGLGVHAEARLVFLVPEGAHSFRVGVGVADEALGLRAVPSMEFRIEVDGQTRASSGPLGRDDGERVLRVEGLQGTARISLICTDAGDLDAGDRGVFAAPLFSTAR